MSRTSAWSREELERARLESFREHGFDAKSRRIVDREGRETYALVRDGDGPPIILVHGGLADASVWSTLAGKLAGRVVVVDRPGCGLSHGIDYRGLDFRAAAAEWLRVVADGLGAERVDLVGNSMGGFFSMAFATAHPERVRRLVLAGAPAGLDRPLPLYLRLLGAPVIGHLVSAMAITDPEVMRKRVMADLVVHPERIPVRDLEIAIANGLLPSSKVAARTMLGAVSDLGGWRPELMMREVMSTLAVPTLFAWGDGDSFAPPSSGRELAARMPNARLEILTDAGHLPQLDQPAALAAAIDAFLETRRAVESVA